MSGISPKVQHVLRDRPRAGHTCHWPGCERHVPPSIWGCKQHWFTLPKPLRDRIWRAYRPGQEDDKRPSETYMEAAHAVQAWIATQQPWKPDRP